MKKKILNPITLFITGGFLGILSKCLDNSTNSIGMILGNIFSELSIWILLGVIITINSETKKKAMINIFTFCIGMLITYYITAEITNSFYSKIFIKGWTIFALFSPLFAYFTWMTKEKGILSKIMSLGIITVTIITNIIIFNGPRIYDILIILILIHILFIKNKS